MTSLDFASPWDFAIIDAWHSGQRNFIARSATEAGDGRGVVNHIGPYEGRIAVNPGSPMVELDVAADGDWAFVVRNVTMATTELARSYVGSGDAVIVFPFDLDDPSPTVEFGRLTASHDGERNFIVRELLGRGLINEIGGYEGTVRLLPDGLFGLEITADGSWELTLE